MSGKEVARMRGTGGTGIDSRREPKLSRKVLRDWLEREGPSPFGALLAQARLQVPDVDAAILQSELSEHPALFSLVTNDEWVATPRTRTVILAPRPRPPASARRKKQPPPSWRRTPDAPATDETFRAERSEVIGITFDAGTAVYDTSERLALALPPPSGDHATPPVEVMHAALGAAMNPLQVFERLPDGAYVYRGLRPIVDVHTQGSDRLVVLLGGAPDDSARARRLGARRAIAALDPARTHPGSSLVLRSGDPEVFGLPELDASLQDLLELPPARREAGPEVLREARRRLQTVGLDGGRWPETALWIGRQLPLVDAATMQEMLTMAVSSRGCPTGEVVAMARVALGDTEATPRFAGAFVVEIASRPELDVTALQFAWGLLPVALEDSRVTPQTWRAAARIAALLADDPATHASAATRFADALEVHATLDPTDLELFAQTAAYSLDPGLVVSALDACTRAIQDSGPRGADERVLDALAMLASEASCSHASALGSARLLFECRAARQEGVDALRAYANHIGVGDSFTFADRLELLSCLEGLETVTDLHSLAIAVFELVISSAESIRRDLLEHAIDQLSFLDELLGSATGLPESARRAISTGLPLAHAVEADKRPLSGARIAIVGFDGTARSRLAKRLIELGGDSTSQVAPSWESRLDSNTVRQAVAGVDLVLELVSQLGHDASEIIKNLKTAGSVFDRRRVTGGPSQAVREAVKWAEGRVA